MSKKTYWEKLRDPRWQKKRLEIMEIHDFQCELCQSENSPLNVHHKVYFKNKEPWEYKNHQLSCLCESCHQIEHGLDEKFKDLISLAEIDGPFSKTDVYWLLSGFFGTGEKPELQHHVNLYLIGDSANKLYGEK